MVSGAESSTRAVLTRGSIYTLASAAQLGAAIVALPILTREVDSLSLGIVSTGLVLIPVLSHLGGIGLPAAVPRPIYDRHDRALEMSRSLLLATFVLAAVVLVGLDLSGPWWSEVFDDLDYGVALRWTVVAALANVVFSSVQHILRAADRPGWFVATSSLAAVGGQAIGLVSVSAGGGASGYLAGIAAGLVLGSGAGVYAIGFHGMRWPSSDLLRSSFRLGAPTVPHLLGLLVLSLGDRIVIERIEGLDSVGEYHVAYVVGALGVVLLSAFNNAWAPMVYGATDRDRWPVLARTTADIYPLAGLIAVGLAVGAPFGLQIVAGDEFDIGALAPVTSLVALSVVPYVAYLARVHVVFHCRRTGVLAWSTPLAAIGNVALNFLLVPAVGLVGAALTTIAAYVLLVMLTDRAARRLADVPWMRSTERAAWMISACGVIVAAVVPVHGGFLLGRGLVGAALAAVLVARLRNLVGDGAPKVSAEGSSRAS